MSNALEFTIDYEDKELSFVINEDSGFVPQTGQLLDLDQDDLEQLSRKEIGFFNIEVLLDNQKYYFPAMIFSRSKLQEEILEFLEYDDFLDNLTSKGNDED